MTKKTIGVIIHAGGDHMKTDKEIRERLRKDLPTIRSVAGWSAERLAELLDVSRVTVVNIENTEGKMTVMQYLAIRALLDAEAKEKLIPLAIETVTNRTLLDSLGQNALKMALPDSAEIIAKEVLKLADKNN